MGSGHCALPQRWQSPEPTPISVTSMATTSSEYSNEVASTSTAIGSRGITLQVGVRAVPGAITVDSSDNTLTGLAAAIDKRV